MKTYNIAVVGATGLVGSTFIKVLEEKSHLPIENIYFFASARSLGKTITFRGKSYDVIPLSVENILGKKIDFALFSAGGAVSREFAPVFRDNGGVVIDNSSAWRMEDSVPLVVPEVNGSACFSHSGIIANPNCSTIQCTLPLRALQDRYGIERIKFVTFQAVSGSGMKGINDLVETTKGNPPAFYPHPIFNNCLPHIDAFLENGYTKEEMKMVNETRKILGEPHLPISATCVRVPIENSHSIDISVELSRDFKIEDVRETLRRFDGIIVVDAPERNEYPIATMATGRDEVFVGRIRRDISVINGVSLFCVADNIRKGAASNAVEIFEFLINSDRYKG